MSSTIKIPEKVILVHMTVHGLAHRSLAEFEALAISAGATIIDIVTGTLPKIDPATFMGSGKVALLASAVKGGEVDLVLFDHPLSPAQERNLERALSCRVLDRTGLILDIFASRARTFEGKLQVELAQLAHLSTRLIRGWTHLERQKGGIGLRGPGETQLESDRRLIRDRIKQIRARLDKVAEQRTQSRIARKRGEIPTVSFVGYTNAGKSTLFNTLTGSQTYAENQLFATLDPLSRSITLPIYGKMVVADTVGFIRDLPHDLVDAFSATLEETREASLLVHVIDLSDPAYREQMEAVETVLAEIGASDRPCLKVFNKIDKIPESQARIQYDEEGRPDSVFLSAYTGAGLDFFIEAIGNCLYGAPLIKTVTLLPSEGKTRSALYDLGAVISEEIDEKGLIHLSIQISLALYQSLLAAQSQKKEK